MIIQKGETMINKRMEEKLAAGDAVDLKDCERVSSADWPGEAYLLKEDSEGVRRLQNDVDTDFCDTSKEAWIWSIGRRIEDGRVFASTTGCFYQHPGFYCMWLR